MTTSVSVVGVGEEACFLTAGGVARCEGDLALVRVKCGVLLAASSLSLTSEGEKEAAMMGLQ